MGPSRKDSTEELNKEEEKLSKKAVWHLAAHGVSHRMGLGQELVQQLPPLPLWPGSRQETATSASSAIILARPDTFGSLQFPEDPSAL